MTAADQLRRVTRAENRRAAAALDRDAAIRASHAAGFPMRTIAHAAGLSVARIHAIIHAA